MIAPPAAPTWINRFLAAASAFACAAALAAVIGTRREGDRWHAGAVADLTVNLNGTPVREHCTTCHPAGAPAIASPGPARSAHPDLGAHDPEDLGCTGCHLGEGMALDTEVSHGRVGNRSRRVLAGDDVQATCYRCHPLAPLPGAERAWNGQRLFREMACGACHHLAGGAGGARYGPDLSRVGIYLSLEQLAEAVAEPQEEPEASTMPRFPLSEAEVVDLAYFLKSQVPDPAYSTPMQRRAADRSRTAPSEAGTRPPAAGAELFRSLGCRACHRLGNEGNWIGPDLTYIARMRSAEYLSAFLDAPGRVIPGSRMPRIPMAPSTRKAAVDFLSGETSGAFTSSSPKRIYMTLCQPCHAADGGGRGILQPNLVQFPRAFRGNAAYFRRVADQRLVQSVRDGVPGTSMPPYRGVLTDAQVDETLELIFRAFIETGRGDRAPLPPLPPKPASPAPQTDVDRAYKGRCQRCHGRAGNGKGPQYARYLPRPRNLTNRPYFESLDDERIARALFDGVPGSAMEGFRGVLPSDLVWGLVDAVRRFSEEAVE
ncbi:MAG: hypothetical protein Kow0092_06750 [Deferrisomatales bacterium]